MKEEGFEVRVPGDKSISQRALILASLAEGKSRIRGLLSWGDPVSTANALRKLGAPIPSIQGETGEVVVEGVGLRGLQDPGAALDLENSGTGARLLLGVLAGQPLEVVLTGDESLRGRPMARITEPLTRMGARVEFLEEPDRLPLRIRGGALKELSYHLPVASAQLKSALLLAGLVGGVRVRIVDPGRSRDHTERIFRSLGIPVASAPGPDGWEVTLTEPPSALPPLDLQVPGDFSSAAFFILLGLLRGGPEPLVLRNVGLNETRTGLLPVLGRMAANVVVDEGTAEEGGEPAGTLVVSPSELSGCEVGEKEIPGLIDEVPILAVGAARAKGSTRITGARELRVKETDRIRAMVENLRAVGVEVEELEDGMVIEGSDRPLRGRVRSLGDHRIAMAFGVLGALPGNAIQIEGAQVSKVSFPGFWELLGRVARRPTGKGRGE